MSRMIRGPGWDTGVLKTDSCSKPAATTTAADDDFDASAVANMGLGDGGEGKNREGGDRRHSDGGRLGTKVSQECLSRRK